jgi:anion-transporting  ArsA/GET3 family ATPase
MTESLDQARQHALDRAVRRAEVLVTTGAGGVGKTTTAAALGLAAAAPGCLVMTIDPARRLAQALGLEHLDSSPQQVDLPGTDGGELHAMMLDMASTFDGVIDRHATTPERARAIKDNRIYQTLSSTLSGTQEYMAMEKLHELHDAGDWDLLVIDTPPTRSALDFLDAPKRMTSFLEGRLLRVLMQPAMSAGKGYLRFLNAGATTFMKVAGRVTGMDLLNDLADFFRIHPRPEVDATVDDLRQAAQRLDDAGKDEEAVADGLRLLADLTGLAGRERRDVEAALFGRRIPALVEVPLLSSDVHDLDGLQQIAGTLARGADTTGPGA